MSISLSRDSRITGLQATLWGWKDGSTAKGACCSCRELRLSFQHPRGVHNCLQLLIQGI